MLMPAWVPPWCRAHLGAEPVTVLHASEHMSEVLGLRLADGRPVAIKSRADQDGRASTCVAVQRALAASGYPSAAPLTEVTVEAGRAIHAEAAVAGAACGAFASAEAATLTPIASSAAFLEAYQEARGRQFDDEEIEVAWAASLWLGLHNARGEALHDLRRSRSARLSGRASRLAGPVSGLSGRASRLAGLVSGLSGRASRLAGPVSRPGRRSSPRSASRVSGGRGCSCRSSAGTRSPRWRPISTGCVPPATASACWAATSTRCRRKATARRGSAGWR